MTIQENILSLFWWVVIGSASLYRIIHHSKTVGSYQHKGPASILDLAEMNYIHVHLPRPCFKNRRADANDFWGFFVTAFVYSLVKPLEIITNDAVGFLNSQLNHLALSQRKGPSVTGCLDVYLISNPTGKQHL